MKSRHAAPRRVTKTMPPSPSLADLFTGSVEANVRRRTLLDAIDLCALIDGEGWINFLPWAHRAGYELPTKRQSGTQRKRGEARAITKDASSRQWERLKVRLRAEGLEVESRAASDYSANDGGNRKASEEAFAHTAMRFTVDGWDRLQALTKALDDWLCSKREEVR